MHERIDALPHDQVLSRLARAMDGADSLESLVRPLLDLLESVTGLESTYLTTVDRQAGVQQVLYARNGGDLAVPEGLEVPWQDTLCRRALEQDRPFTDDIAATWPDAEAARQLGIVSYASSPVQDADGTLYGTLCAASRRHRPLPPGADKVLDLVARLIAFQVERERLIESLRRSNRMLSTSALTDEVTGLPNRRALIADMRRRMRESGTEPSVLLVGFIDLDHFKAINDQHGHDAGDRFLRAMSGRLRKALRGDDMVARMGGDEFAVISSVAPARSDPALSSLRERLRRATRGRFQLGAIEIDYAGPSIDVIQAPPGASDPEALLAQADAAMYAIKRARRNQR